MLIRSVVFLAITISFLSGDAPGGSGGQNRSSVDQWIQKSYEATDHSLTPGFVS